jgi:hypothetical protein
MINPNPPKVSRWPVRPVPGDKVLVGPQVRELRPETEEPRKRTLGRPRPSKVSWDEV